MFDNVFIKDKRQAAERTEPRIWTRTCQLVKSGSQRQKGGGARCEPTGWRRDGEELTGDDGLRGRGGQTCRLRLSPAHVAAESNPWSEGSEEEDKKRSVNIRERKRRC